MLTQPHGSKILDRIENGHAHGIEFFTMVDLQKIDRYTTTHIEASLYAAIMTLAEANYSIWHHEDYARLDDMGIVFNAKKAIDRYNQYRNDLIAVVDMFAIGMGHSKHPRLTGPINSETYGSLVDRCSIVCLKYYHTRELVMKHGRVDLESREATLLEQIQFLDAHMVCLGHDIMANRRSIRVFHQLKMYNDQSLNEQTRKSQ